MSATTTPPIPRQPIGTTFIVSVCVLGAVALLQIIAVIIPLVRQQIARQSSDAPVTVQPVPAASAPVAAQSTAVDSAQSAEMKEKVAALYAEADKSFRLGQFEDSLRKLDEMEVILPGDPYVLFLRGQIFERVGKPVEAAMAFEAALQVPGFPLAYRKQAEMKLKLLEQTDGFEAQKRRMEAVESGGIANQDSGPMKDEFGLQPGATLAIVEAKLRDVRKGMKSLRVAVKARPDAKVMDPGTNVRLSVSFYEKTEDGEIVLTESQILSQWISQPLDWAENLPEILDVQYPLPDGGNAGSSGANGAPGRTYYGYTVGVYYDGELQDSRADPGSLDKQHPLPLYLKQ